MQPHAVITGGTQGIGLELVRHFLEQGFTVTTCGRHTAKLPGEIAGHPALRPYRADLTVKADVMAFAAHAIAHGPATVLIHNAGIFLPGSIDTEEDGVLERSLALNVEAAYHLTRALLPHMRAACQGHIITLCSIASLQPYKPGASYTISKWALLGFTKQLREELLGTPLRVTAILPGPIRTPSWDGTDLPADRFIPMADIVSTIWATYQMAPTTVIEEVILRPLSGRLD